MGGVGWVGEGGVGDSYDGEYVAGMPCGAGRLEWPWGDTYQARPPLVPCCAFLRASPRCAGKWGDEFPRSAAPLIPELCFAHGEARPGAARLRATLRFRVLRSRAGVQARRRVHW